MSENTRPTIIILLFWIGFLLLALLFLALGIFELLLTGQR